MPDVRTLFEHTVAIALLLLFPAYLYLLIAKRKHPWAIIWWLPLALGVLRLVVYVISVTAVAPELFSWNSLVTAPDAGGLAIIYVWVTTVMTVVGVTLVYFTRPTGSGLNIKRVSLAFTIWIIVAVALYLFFFTKSLILTFTDENTNRVPHVQVTYRSFSSSPEFFPIINHLITHPSNGTAFADSSGKLKLRFKSFGYLEIDLQSGQRVIIAKGSDGYSVRRQWQITFPSVNTEGKTYTQQFSDGLAETSKIALNIEAFNNSNKLYYDYVHKGIVAYLQNAKSASPFEVTNWKFHSIDHLLLLNYSEELILSSLKTSHYSGRAIRDSVINTAEQVSSKLYDPATAKSIKKVLDDYKIQSYQLENKTDPSDALKTLRDIKNTYLQAQNAKTQ